MLFQLNILPNDSKLGIWKMEEETEKLQSLLSKQCLTDNRFLSFKNEIRKVEWLCARVLIKELCGEEKKIEYTDTGKPQLTDKSFKISISHTKNYVAVCLHPTKEVGIDIEKISDKVLNIKHKFLSEKELSNLDKENINLAALLHWSAKETLFKLMPQTGIDFCNHLYIAPFKVKEKGCLEAQESRTNKKETFKVQYQVFDDFVLTWCSK